MNENYSALRANISQLGQLLGQTIQSDLGEELLNKVECIRQLAKSSRAGDQNNRQALLDALQNLSDNELVPVARAFGQFLNLANIAEQFHTISRKNKARQPDQLAQAFRQLKQADLTTEQIEQAVQELQMDLVLTAHPTEITRRTLIAKQVAINECLEMLSLSDLMEHEKELLMARIEQLIAQGWHTDVIRQQRPTPVDEAKWGFAVVEKSLWSAVPSYMRQLNHQLQQELGLELPLDATPVRFYSWMGGDRDGNPFVTADVTREVIYSGRWSALNLYRQDLNQLISELSMNNCSPELRAEVGECNEPYRVFLHKLRHQVDETLDYLTACLAKKQSEARDLIRLTDQLRTPLTLVFNSLESCGQGIIARGALLDFLYRLGCFGVSLVKLDIRQDGGRHCQVLSEITRYLGIGDYAQWDEADKIAFLQHELNNRRPLLPRTRIWKPTEDTQEVLDSLKVISEQEEEYLGIYIISMAQNASDVLAVQLLLRETGCSFKLPVAPLFETLDDLNNAEPVISQLLELDNYRSSIDDHQHVMIGYSDSAKDAGVLAASWAQYRSQESLIHLCEEKDIKLTLFHGRGGTIGRGGAPALDALLSQPPGSLKGGLRVTEQGEMIRFKYGLPQVAIDSLTLYTQSILQANLLPPPKPRQKWREMMDQISDDSCAEYREIVREHPDFVPYFRAATPELELGKLPLGSRPSKRNPQGGVESLRAIPWIFAWTQNRLMLPAWLGFTRAFENQIAAGHTEEIIQMNQDWPFFRTRLEMLEMVFLKADTWLAEYYDQQLVPKEYWPLGELLRNNLQRGIDLIIDIHPQKCLMPLQHWSKQSIAMRNPYTDPLNILQAELLKRSRQSEGEHPLIDEALMISIAGVAAGMRNTG